MSTAQRPWRLAAIVCALLLALHALRASAAADRVDAALDHQLLVMARHPPEHYRADGSYAGGYGDALARSAQERLARGIARRYGLVFVRLWPMPMIGVDCFVMSVPDGRSTRDAAEQVSRDRNVAWAEPMAMYVARESRPAHNDPLYPVQPAATEWHLADLHRIATGKGVRVAVIDSGIDAAHPDLAGQLLVDRNFVAGQTLVAEDHGTAVAGIIAAKADNGIGIAGVSPAARLLGLRACWQTAASTICDTLSLAKALYFAIEGHAEVINLSLSGPDARLLRELIGAALRRGSAVVGAFDRNLPNGGFPASIPGVFAVSDEMLEATQSRVYTAPGRGVPTTEPRGRWSVVNGSSFAAAHVSGLIALMREHRHSSSSGIVALRQNGGPINACATLLQAAGGCDCVCGNIRLATRARRE